MDRTLLEWLSGLGWSAFTWSLGGLLLGNGVALLLFFRKRDRALVQQYTSLWLGANLLLVAIGVGVPAIAAVARLAVLGARTVAPALFTLPVQTPEARVHLADY